MAQNVRTRISVLMRTIDEKYPHLAHRTRVRLPRIENFVKDWNTHCEPPRVKRVPMVRVQKEVPKSQNEVLTLPKEVPKPQKEIPKPSREDQNKSVEVDNSRLDLFNVGHLKGQGRKKISIPKKHEPEYEYVQGVVPLTKSNLEIHDQRIRNAKPIDLDQKRAKFINEFIDARTKVLQRVEATELEKPDDLKGARPVLSSGRSADRHGCQMAIARF